jgi:D-glycero-alpha-D-manno-heptose-7-phosphate kinase
MLLVRSPLRISLGGGGTDLPSYYRKRGGYLIASAIDKYVYTSAIKPFKEGIFLKYSEVEKVKEPSEIKHKIFREILMMSENIEPYQIELTTLADIPSGTGLGSSGAFTVSVLKALQMFNLEYSTNESIAKLACQIEIERLNQPVGKQDQYASAIGGLTEFIFHKDDSVEFKRLPIDDESLNNIQDSILMFFTGYSRSASSILSNQDQKTKSDDNEMLYNLDSVKEMGEISRNLLINGDLNQYGLLMLDHWENKLKRSPNMCSEEIQKFHKIGIENGAIGGKLVGAGGGGFLLFIAQDKIQLRKAMNKIGLKELRFNIDKLGVHVLQA